MTSKGSVTILLLLRDKRVGSGVAAHDDRSGTAHHSCIASGRHVVHLERGVIGALAHGEGTALAISRNIAVDRDCRLAVRPGDDRGSRPCVGIVAGYAAGVRAGSRGAHDRKSEYPANHRSHRHVCSPFVESGHYSAQAGTYSAQDLWETPMKR